MATRSLKIYTPQDLEGLQDIEHLKQTTHETCEALLADARKKCEDLKTEAYQSGLDKLHSEQLALLGESHAKVTEFFARMTTQFQALLQTLCEKLKTHRTMTESLSALLFAEVDRLKIKSQKFTIYANPSILPALQKHVKSEYENESLSFDFDVRPDLADDECLVESDYVMVRIAVADFYERVWQALLGQKDQENNNK